MSSVRILKFISGEEIVATVTYPEGVDDKVHVTDPLMLIPSPGPDGKMTIAITTWAQSTQGILEIDKRNILYDASPDDVLKQKYNKIFGNIVVPTQSIARV